MHSPVGHILIRFSELALVVIGLAYNFTTDLESTEISYLAVWDVIAVCYLSIGFWVVRRSRFGSRPADDDGQPRWLRILGDHRFSFLFTVAASLTGLGAAIDMLLGGGSTTLESTNKIVGTIAVLCAWLLLHAGYARFYGGIFRLPGDSGDGLRFPNCDRPGSVEFLYFSFTVGVSFAVSDVEVTRRPVRWYVMTHSVVSFFYNAAVLAVAVGVLTGK